MKNRTVSHLQSMTPEEWYDSSKPVYKRRKGDTPFVCPYCGKATRMTNDKYLAYYYAKKHGTMPKTVCLSCEQEFYFMPYSAEECRRLNTRATWRKEELDGTATFKRIKTRR